MSDDTSLVSVIVPCYNQAHYLSDVLTSVSIATAKQHEVIIINDGSTAPATHRFLAELRPVAAHQSIVVVNKENGGLANTRNEGLKLARGSFVQFLDADDLLYRDSIDFRIAEIEKHDLDAAICDFSFCNEERNHFWQPNESLIAEKNFSFFGVSRYWERGFSIPIHCGLFRKSILDGAVFHEGLRAKEDWIFWLGFFLKTSKVKHVKRRGACYRMHNNNMTRDGRLMAIAWIDAMLIARQVYPHFDDECVKICLNHLKDYYFRYFWLHNRGFFVSQYYEALVWSGRND